MTGPVNSTLAFYRRSQTHIAGLREQAERLQGQVSTGEKLSRSSDDPVAASRLRVLERLERLATIDEGNAKGAADDLQLSAEGLSNIADAIIRVRELALRAASDTSDDAERSAIATEIDQIRLNIMATANGLDSNGNALFGGETNGKAYEVDASGAVVYIGTASSTEADLGQGQSVTRGLTGPEVLSFNSNGVDTDVFEQIAQLSALLRSGGASSPQAARDALTGLDDALDSVTRSQTVVGSRIAWLDVVQDRQLDQSLNRSRQISDTNGVEFTSAVAELQQVLTVLEASQASFVRLAGLSLFRQI